MDPQDQNPLNWPVFDEGDGQEFNVQVDLVHISDENALPDDFRWTCSLKIFAEKITWNILQRIPKTLRTRRSFFLRGADLFGAGVKNRLWAIDISVLHAPWLLDNEYLAHEVQEILNVSHSSINC